MSLSKKIGCCMLIIGTEIGAGVLALPMAAAKLGFAYSLLLLLAVWLVMSYTAFLVLEVNLGLPEYQNTFGTMAKVTLGKIGQIITWVASLLLLYALTSAYIQGMGSLLCTMFQSYLHCSMSIGLSSLLFTVVLGFTVFWSTAFVDKTNRFVLSFKGVLVLLSLGFLMPHVNWPQLLTHNDLLGKSIAYTAPIFVSAFAFHSVIPSITNYLGKDAFRDIRQVIIISTSITFVIYVLWLIAMLGVIPVTGSISFAAIAQKNNDVGYFISSIGKLINNQNLNFLIVGFSNIAMITSFLGVSLGLFDFLADGCQRKNSRVGRGQTAFLTFIPPLLLAIFYPNGFVLALNYAAIFVGILQIILPAAMAWKGRKLSINILYQVRGNSLILFTLAVIGLIVIAFALHNNF